MRETTKTVFHNGHRYRITRTANEVTVQVMVRAPRHGRSRWRRILHEGPTGLAVLAKEANGGANEWLR